MTTLLLDEKPLIILPKLAEKIGLNESIVLQQFHYWLKESSNIRDGYKWVYNTYEDWQKQFPFWSVRTLKRIITNLENNQYLISANYNKLQIDRTKWYRINYDQLMERPTCQLVTMEGPTCHDGRANLAPPLPEITTEITTETTTSYKTPLDKDEKNQPVRNIPYKAIIDYLNEKAGKRYSHTAKDNRKLIKNRFEDGFTLEDFYKVIDTKARQWRYSPKWDKFLRPSTLFAPSHFDNYLNEVDEGASFGSDLSQYDFTKEIEPDF